jgi:ParB-like chromosome segregation protein Spo0J
MSKTKPRFTSSPLTQAMANTTSTIQKQNGYELRSVQFIPPADLKINSRSDEYFSALEGDERARLVEDIRKRGVLVPLIAKLDNTLLAGHNRLSVALELGLRTVPVQYVVTQLSEEEEREFIVKDNLLRRQLTLDDRLKLYRALYKNFDERVNLRPVEGGGDKFPTSDIAPLTAAKIAKDTGQEREAVKKQLQRAREKYVAPKNDAESEREKIEEYILKVSTKAKSLSQDDRKALASVLRKVARDMEK